MGERDRLRHDLLENRAELKIAVAVREQLQERLRAGSPALPPRKPGREAPGPNKTRAPTAQARPRKRLIQLVDLEMRHAVSVCRARLPRQNCMAFEDIKGAIQQRSPSQRFGIFGAAGLSFRVKATGLP